MTEIQMRVTPAGDSFTVAAPGLARALGFWFWEARDLIRTLPESEKGSEVVPIRLELDGVGSPEPVNEVR